MKTLMRFVLVPVVRSGDNFENIMIDAIIDEETEKIDYLEEIKKQIICKKMDEFDVMFA